MVEREKYSEIFGSTSKYSILRIILFSISYIFYIFITRFLGPEEFGKLALVIQLGTELGTILVIGLPMTLTRFIPEAGGENEKKRLFSQSINISLLIFCGFAVIYFIVTYFLRDHIPEEIVEAKYYLFAFILIIGIVKIAIGMLSGLGRFISGTIFDGLNHLVWRLAGMLVLIFVALKQFELIFSLSVLAHLLTMVILLIVLRHYFCAAGIKIDPMIMRFTLLIMTSQVVFAVIAIIDPLLIRLILDSSSEVGFFYTGTRIPFLFQTLFFAPLSIPFLYYFSKPDLNFADKERIIRFGTKMLGVIFGAVSFIVYSLADKFIIFLFGNAYENSIMVLKIFAFSLFFIAIEVFLSPYFLSVNKPFIPVILGVSYLVLVIILDFVFIPIFNSAGPAISILICLALRITAYLILLKKQGIGFIKTYIILIAAMAVSLIIDLFLLSYSGIFIFIILVFAFKLVKIGDLKNMVRMLKEYGK